jgi:hypothetical protein
MSLKVRLLIYGLCGVMTGFWLSMAAFAVVLTSGKPQALVEFAYWPARVSGIPPSDYMHPNFVGPIFLNIAGWTLVAEIVGLYHHWVSMPRTAVQR